MQREESQEIVAVENKSLKAFTEEQLQAWFSVHTVNVNAAKSGKVLDKFCVNVYIYVFFFSFKVQVVIWETLRACYFRCTIVPLNRLFSFFFNQDTAFYTVGARQSHHICLSAC